MSVINFGAYGDEDEQSMTNLADAAYTQTLPRRFFNTWGVEDKETKEDLGSQFFPGRVLSRTKNGNVKVKFDSENRIYKYKFENLKKHHDEFKWADQMSDEDMLRVARPGGNGTYQVTVPVPNQNDMSPAVEGSAPTGARSNRGAR